MIESKPTHTLRTLTSKLNLNRVVNLCLWLCACVMTGTGLLIAFRLPPGSRGGRGLSILGWSRHDWGDLHRWFSYGFLALIVIHMLLHWRWLWTTACRKIKWPVVLGLLFGLAIIAVLWFLPITQGTDDHGEGHGHGRGQGRGLVESLHED
ncbi:MAG: DUF4405 domain-containing protein [Verrucomicrobia bacterium]|nr:DUF4405 domain-containing protein [Kiritimatiellia bacterium]MCP5488790.1 DUF4405 domain-containing protein [Verrucomicrobiota bacterium]